MSVPDLCTCGHANELCDHPRCAHGAEQRAMLAAELTAPDRADASARRVRISDELLTALLSHKTFTTTQEDNMALDLRDARQLAADQAARIAELEQKLWENPSEVEAYRCSEEIAVRAANEQLARADRLASEAQATREAGLREAAEIADARVAIDKRLSESGKVSRSDALLCILTGEGIAEAIRARLSTEGEKGHG